jgi:threonine dehydratase
MLVSPADLRRAEDAVAAVAIPTPVSPSPNLSSLAGRMVLLKHEERQRTGSFKIRGAANFVAGLDASVQAVVAASAGNHAQGVALAASSRGLASTVFMPETTPLPKLDATRGYGATVKTVSGGVEACIDAARTASEAEGTVYVPPFDDPLVIAGQATVGLEIATEAPDEVETVVVPVGGGGLIAGVATALAHRRRGIRVIGVEAAEAASMAASVSAGAVTTIEVGATMADGIAVAQPSELTLAHVRAYVDEMVSVTEEEISQAMVLLLERTKSLVEPAGATGVAALLAGKVSGTGPTVAVLSGGNVDPLLLIKLVDHGLSAAGRYVVVRVLLPDRPGMLASLLREIADLGLNVLAVEHHRSGLDLAVDQVEVRLTLETRDPDHHDEVIAALVASGHEATTVA